MKEVLKNCQYFKSYKQNKFHAQLSANAQADLGLCCPHIPEDTVSHGMAHFIDDFTLSKTH